MKQDSQQKDSLKKSIEILAEMTRKDIQKSYKIENFSNTKLSRPKTALTSHLPLKELLA